MITSQRDQMSLIHEHGELPFRSEQHRQSITASALFAHAGCLNITILASYGCLNQKTLTSALQG